MKKHLVFDLSDGKKSIRQKNVLVLVVIGYCGNGGVRLYLTTNFSFPDRLMKLLLDPKPVKDCRWLFWKCTQEEFVKLNTDGSCKNSVQAGAGGVFEKYACLLDFWDCC